MLIISFLKTVNNNPKHAAAHKKYIFTFYHIKKGLSGVRFWGLGGIHKQKLLFFAGSTILLPY